MSKNHGMPQPPANAQGQPQPWPAQAVPPYQPSAAPTQGSPVQTPQAVPVPGAPQVPQQAVPVQAVPAYGTQVAPAQPALIRQNMPVAPGQGIPGPSQDSEVFFGGKVVGVIAALLVLSGLILLGASFIPQLPDMVKAVFIFLFAILLTGGGAFLVTKSRNVFTYALFVSGMAAFFVAIWASWAFFGLFNHTTALVVSGIWMAVTIALVIHTRTWPLAIALCALAGLFGVGFLEGDAVRIADGYDFINNNLQPWMAAAFILAGLYIVALGIAGMKLAVKSATPEGSNLASVHKKVLASFFVSEAALFFAGITSSWQYAQGAMLVLFIAILIVAARSPLPAPLHSNQPAWRVNEIVVFTMAALGFLLTSLASSADLFTAVTYGLFTIGAVALAGMRAHDRTKEGYVRPQPAIPVLFALSLSGVVTNYLCGIPFEYVSPYVWSAVAIVCALVTIAAGFWFGEKPLRLCGLVLTLLCILKIAVFDLSGDALAHAVALVVAGLVCFGISALYTYANKHLS